MTRAALMPAAARALIRATAFLLAGLRGFDPLANHVPPGSCQPVLRGGAYQAGTSWRGRNRRRAVAAAAARYLAIAQAVPRPANGHGRGVGTCPAAALLRGPPGS